MNHLTKLKSRPFSFSLIMATGAFLITCGLQYLQTGICLFFFGFAVVFSVLSFSAFILRYKPWCNCETCKSYLSSSWVSEFDNLCDWYSHLLQKSPTGSIHIHVLGNVITANPANVEYILKTRFENFPKGKPFSAILGDLLGRGIFNVDGDSWKFQRKMASLELGSVSIRSYAFDIVTSEIRSRLIPLLSSSSGNVSNFDLQDVLRRFSFDTICKFSFGVDPACLDLSLPVSELATAFDLASTLSAQRAMTPSPFVWKLKRFFNLGSEKQLKQAVNMVDSLAMEVIRHKRKSGFSSHSDLLSRFMGTIDDENYLRDIVVSFLLAGRDTVASALTCLFWLLANNPEVMEKVLEESNRIMGSCSAADVDLASYEQLQKMHYLQAVMYESMRLYPPVQFDSKFCEEDDVLPDGTFVSKATRVTYHPYAMGRMPNIWGDDCLEFNPGRWLRDGVFKPESPFKYPVFQGGVRVCLGKDIALVEMKSIALCLIRQFEVKVDHMAVNNRPKFVPGLTASLRGGLPVQILERRRQS